MILIDMEMPTGCDECPCCQPDAHFNRYTCGVDDDDDVMDDETGEIFQVRPPWCPLKEM